MPFDFLRPNPQPSTGTGPGLRVPGRQSPFGRFPIPGAGGGIDILRSSTTVDEADAVDDKDHQAHGKTLEELDTLGQQIAQGEGKKKGGITAKDFLFPALAAGFMGMFGGAKRGNIMRSITAGVNTFAEQEKEKTRVMELDRKFNALEKQRRYTKVSKQIEQMRKIGTPEMNKVAAALMVKMFKDADPTIKITESEVAAMLDAKNDKQKREDLDKELTVMINRGFLQEAMEFEEKNWDVLHPGMKLTPEERRKNIDKWDRMMKQQEMSDALRETNLEGARQNLRNAAINQVILTYKKDNLGTADSRDLLTHRKSLRGLIDSAVITSVRTSLSPETRRAVDEKTSKNLDVGMTPMEASTKALNDVLAAAEAGKGRKPDERLGISGKHYVDVWKNITPDLLTVKGGRSLTFEDVFPEGFIREAGEKAGAFAPKGGDGEGGGGGTDGTSPSPASPDSQGVSEPEPVDTTTSAFRKSQDFFQTFHDDVMNTGRVGTDPETGKSHTMLISGYGFKDPKTGKMKEYLLPAYDPETGTVLTDAQVREKFRDRIASGEIEGFESIEQATAAARLIRGRVLSGSGQGGTPPPSQNPVQAQRIQDILAEMRELQRKQMANNGELTQEQHERATLLKEELDNLRSQPESDVGKTEQMLKEELDNLRRQLGRSQPESDERGGL